MLFLKIMIASWWLYNGGYEFLWISIEHQTVRHVLNFLVKILLIVTWPWLSWSNCEQLPILHDVCGWTSSVGSVSGTPWPFLTPLNDQDIQGQKSIIIFHFHCELGGRPKAVEVPKKLLQSCWSMGPKHEHVINNSQPFSGIVVSCVIQYRVRDNVQNCDN